MRVRVPPEWVPQIRRERAVVSQRFNIWSRRGLTLRLRPCEESGYATVMQRKLRTRTRQGSKMRVLRWLQLAALLVGVRSEESAESGVCEAPGLWGDLLVEWATGAGEHSGRQGRVMSLPPTKGYYVTERIDGPLVPPPPPPHRPHGAHTGTTGQHGAQTGTYGGNSVQTANYGGNSAQTYLLNNAQNGAYGPNSAHAGPHGQHHQPAYSQYDEWKATPPPSPGASKIVNRPPNPYKDKFKPSYGPSQAHPPSIPVSGAAADRVDSPPRQVSETDLYLLTAIEKLVYRVDLMEKRLRRTEETMHFLVAGKDPKPELCPANWRRLGGACLHVSSEAVDWKAASVRCRKLRGHLLELDTDLERRTIFSALLADRDLKGTDFWTGGLNPGLLWIWTHSAQPLAANSTGGTNSSAGSSSGPAVLGEGRCLALVHDPAAATYLYRGQDCGLQYRFICEVTEDKARLSNEIERVARQLRELGTGVARKSKLLWDADKI